MSELDPQKNFISPGYISSREAGDRFGLTNDYVARLCRQGKVRGALIGKVWFVEESSLSAFVALGERRRKHYTKELQKSRRAEYLRNQRPAQISAKPLVEPNIPSAPRMLPTPMRISAPVPEMPKEIPVLTPLPQAPCPGAGMFETLLRGIPLSAALSLGAVVLVAAAYAVSLPPITGQDAAALQSVHSQFFSSPSNDENVFARALGALASFFFGGSPATPTEHSSAPIVAAPVAPAPTLPANYYSPAPTPSAPRSAPSSAPAAPARTIERVVVEQSGISTSTLEARLQEFGNALRSEIYGNITSAPTPPSSGGFTNNIALTNRIDQLKGVTLTDVTINGVSGLSASDFGALPLSGGRLTGQLMSSSTATTTFSNGFDILAGCFSINGVCISSSGGGAGNPGGSDTQIQYNDGGVFNGAVGFVWDKTNARLGVGTTTPYAKLTVWGLGTGSELAFVVANSASTTVFSVADSGLVTLPNLLATASSTLQNFTFQNATGTSATTTNFFATTASSTNLFAQTASFGSFSLSTPLAVSSGGTGASSFSQGWIFSTGSGALSASTSPTVNYITATSTTATSTFAAGIEAANLSVTGYATTSSLTVSNGLTLSSVSGSVQCLHVNSSGSVSGTGSDCGSGGGGTTPGGTSGQLQYNNGGVFGGASNLIWNSGTSRLGIGTTSPFLALSVEGASTLGSSATAGFFVGTTTATSTLAGGLQALALNVTSASASSTFANGINLSAGCFSVNGTCVTGGGSGTPGGANTQVQFNDSGAFNGVSTFTFNKATGEAGLTGIIATNATTTNATTTRLAVTGTGTTTVAYGLNVASSGGCLAVNGACLSTGSLTNYWTSSGSTLFNNTGTLIGVNNSSPSYALDVGGFINTDQFSGYKQAGVTILSASSTNFATLVGNGAGAALKSTALRNTAVGFQALNAATTPADLTAMGYQALANNVTGASNSAFGSSALAANVSGAQNTAVGASALTANVTGASNAAFGYNALSGNTTGGRNAAFGAGSLSGAGAASDNAAFGYNALGANTSGTQNVAIGSGALSANTSGSQNIGISYNALNLNTTGTNNIAFGASALAANSTGSYNIAIGVSALAANNGDENIAFGHSALAANTNGTENSAFGLNTLTLNTTGFQNVAFGYNALQNSISGTGNAALGFGALRFNGSATSSTAVGYQAGYGSAGLSASQNNTFLGYQAGFGNTTGNNNTLLGYKAGSNLTTGSGNIVLGYNLSAPSATANNQLSIGNLLYGTNLDGQTTTYSTGQIGVGSTSPFARFAIHANNGDTNTTLFAVGSSTATATTTLFTILNNGNVGIGTTSPFAPFSVNGSGFFGGNVTASNLIATGSITFAGLGNNVILSTDASGLLTGTSTPSAANYLATSSTATSTFAGGLTVAGVPGLTVLQNGFIGIGTRSPITSLDINATDALRIPVGTTAQRPGTTLTGQIRYNNQTHQFEGFSDAGGGVWQGLGGVTDSDQNTYIQASTTNASYDFLDFVTAGAERFTITNTGNIGVASTSPFAKFSVHALNGETNTTLFAVASSTATATTTLFSIGNNGLVTLPNLLATASSTLQNFTFLQATGTNATTTNFFATTASSTNLFAQTATLGNLLLGASTTLQNFTFLNATGTNATTTNFFSTTASSTNLFAQTATLGNLLLGASTTLQNFTFLNATGTSATTTNFFATTASSTNLFSSLLTVGGTGLVTNASGQTALGTSTPYARLTVWGTGTGAEKAFEISNTASTTVFSVADSGLVTLPNLLATASSTLQNFTFLQATGTSATTTNFFATTASSTNLFAQTATLGNLLLGASTTLQNFTFLNATGTNATTTNFFSTTASSTNLFSSALAVGGTTLVTSSGNVGVGSSSPTQKLTLGGGNILHVAVGNPTLAASNDLTGGTENGIAISGRYAYISGFNPAHGLKIVDINNPTAPVLLKKYATTGNTWGVAFAGQYAFLAEDTSGLEIVDVSNPNNPVRASLTGLPSGAALGVAVAGKYAYVAGGSGGLRVFDISNPQAPTLIGTKAFTNAKSVTISGSYAYVADGTSGTEIVDISTPAAPLLIATVASTDGTNGAYSNYVSGRYLYIADGTESGLTGGLRIFDITNPASPSLVSTYRNGSGTARSIAVAGRYAYLGYGTSGQGVYVLDVSTPSTPVLVGSISLASDDAAALAIAGKYAFVADSTNGLKVVDINGMETPALTTGSVNSNNLFAAENITAGNNLSVGGGLTVGYPGIFSRGAIAAYISSSTASNPIAATFLGGNVGIGTTSPYSRLTIWGPDTSASTNALLISNNASTTLLSVADSGLVTLPNLLATASSTLQNLTFLQATGTNATTTNFFATTASSTNLFAQTATLGNLLLGASTTLQNFTFINATGTSATTTNFFATTASSTNLFAQTATLGGVAGLNVLAGGNSAFGTATPYARLTVWGPDTAATTRAFEVANNASTTVFSVTDAGLITVPNLLATASSTLQNFTFLQATGTNATTTNFFATTASSTNLFAQTATLGNLLLGASTTLQNFTFINATGTSATTTNFFATTASSTNLFAQTATIGGTAGLNVLAAGFTGISSSTPWGLFSINPTANIGAAPAFVVGSSTATNFIVDNAGNVGLGTTSPFTTLAVNGNAFFGGNLTANYFTATSTSLVSSFGQLLANASTTLQNFTFINATGTSATTTNFFATTASSTNLFAQTATLGGIAGLNVLAGGNSAFGTATPYARLTVWGPDTAATTRAFEVANNASTTVFSVTDAGLITVPNLLATASSTLQNFTFLQATGTNATTTNFAATGTASTTALSVSNGGTLGGTFTGTNNTLTLPAFTLGGDITGNSKNLTGLNTLTVTGASGNTVAFDTSTFIVDATNHLVGIGQTTPAYKLDVTGNAHFTSLVDADHFVATSSSVASIFNGGFQANASSTLQNFTALQSTSTNATTTNFAATGTASTSVLSVSNGGTLGGTFTGTTNTLTLPAFTLGGDITGNSKNITGLNSVTVTGTTNATSTFSTGGLTVGTNQFVVQQTSGRVGIGTSSPYTALAVVGTTTASSFVATSTTEVSNFQQFLATNATTTNFFATTASSTNLFAQTATIGSTLGLNVLAGGTTGIGSTSPWARFAVNPIAGDSNQFVVGSSTATSFLIDSAGNIAVASTSANHKLDINGNLGLAASSYFNFGNADGTGGYGFRDNGGTLEAKNAGGTWSAIGSGSQWTTTANGGIYFTTAGTGSNTQNVSIGTTTTSGAVLTLATSSVPQLVLTDISGGVNQKHFYASSTQGSLVIGTEADNLTTLTPLIALNGVQKELNPGAGQDNALKLGTSTARWSELNLGTSGTNIWQTTGTNYEKGNLGFTTVNGAPTLSLATSKGGSGQNRDIYIKAGSGDGLYVGAGGQTGIGYTSFDTSIGDALLVNGRIGIGTTTPKTALEIAANGRNSGESKYGLRLANTDNGSQATGIELVGSGATGSTWIVGTDLGAANASGFYIGTSTAGATNGPTYAPFQVTSDGAVKLTDTSNVVAGNKLYAQGGGLYWDGTQLNGAGITNYLTQNGTTNYLSTWGNSLGVGTSTAWARLAVAGSAGSATNLFAVSTTTSGNATSTAFIINQDGRVGIGTSSPSDTFAVNGTSFMSAIIPNGPYTNNLAAYDLGATGQRWNALWAGTLNVGTSTFSLKSDANSNLGIFTAASGGGTEAMTITSAGKVGIGTTSPYTALAVFGTTTSSSFVATSTTEVSNLQQLLATNATTTNFFATTASSTNLFAQTATIGGLNGLNVPAGGNVGIGETAPGSKLSVSGGGTFGSGYDTTAAPTNGLIIEGNVGIGTTTPGYKLTVQTADNAAVHFTGATSAARFLPTAGLYKIDGVTMNEGAYGPMWLGGSTLQFGISGTEKMRIDSNGNVGINNTSPSYKLDVSGFINTDQYSGYKQAGDTILYASSTNAATLVGIGAGANLTSVVGRNTALGNNALNVATSSKFNTAIGERALRFTADRGDSSGGWYNTAVGGAALTANTYGGFNTAVGEEALASAMTSDSNTVVGSAAFISATGARNTGIGASVATNLTSGSGNIMIGYNVKAPSATGDNQLNIGELIFATGLGSGGTISTGNVGIGTTSPLSKLHVLGSGTGILNIAGSATAPNAALFEGPTLAITNAGLGTNLNVVSNSTEAIDAGGSIGLGGKYGSGGTWANYGIIKGGKENSNSSDYAGYLAFATAPSGNGGLIDRLHITSTGNVGIGTTTPNAILTVNSGNLGTAVLVSSWSDATPVSYIQFYNANTGGNAPSSDNATIKVRGMATSNFAINVGGDIKVNGSGATCTIGNGTGATNCTSDQRLKTNIASITDPLAALAKIRGVTFNWADPSKNQSQQVGVIAQDVLQAFPQLVATTTATFDGTEGSYYTVDYAGLVSPLIAGVNELNTRVNSILNGTATSTITNVAEVNATTTSTDTLCLSGNCVSNWNDLANFNNYVATSTLADYVTNTAFASALANATSTLSTQLSALVASSSLLTTNYALLTDSFNSFASTTATALASLNTSYSILHTDVASTTAGLASTTHYALRTASDVASTTSALYGLRDDVTNALANLPTSSTTPITGNALALIDIPGLCVTGDTKLRRRRRKTQNTKSKSQTDDDDYIYEDVDIVDIKAGDEIASLDETTGRVVWRKVLSLAYMGTKQTFRLITADGRSIRTTDNHPYLSRRGWKKVKHLSVGDEIAVTSTDDFGNAFGNLDESLWRKSAELASYEPLVNRYNLSDKHNSFFKQAGTLLFSAFDKVVASFGGRPGLRSERNQNNVIARAVECVGGNNKSGTLLERAEVGEGKGDEDDVAALIPGHRLNPGRYSRNQKTVLQVSAERDLQSKGRSASAIVQAVGAGLQVLTSLLPAQFALRSSFAYAGSIPPAQMKLQWSVRTQKSGLGEFDQAGSAEARFTPKEGLRRGGALRPRGNARRFGSQSEAALGMGCDKSIANHATWAKIVSIEPVAREDVFDIEVEGTHNFIGNGIVAHNTYLGSISTDLVSTSTLASTLAAATSTLADSVQRLADSQASTTVSLDALRSTLNALAAATSTLADSVQRLADSQASTTVSLDALRSTLNALTATSSLLQGGTLAGDILPNADAAYDLGSASARFAHIFGDKIIAGDLGFTETANPVNLPAHTFAAGDIVALSVKSTGGSCTAGQNGTCVVPVDLLTAINTGISGANSLYLNTSGGVGVGVASTSALQAELDVRKASVADTRLLSLNNASATGNLSYQQYIGAGGDLVMASNDNSQGTRITNSRPVWNLTMAGLNDYFDIGHAASGSGTFSNTSALRITNGGLIGIGTTTPFAKFAINPIAGDTNQFVVGSSTATSFIINNAGLTGVGSTTPFGRFSVSTSNLASGVPEFVVGSSTRTDLIIDQGGTVGIGTAAPSSSFKLDINGAVQATNLQLIGSTTLQNFTALNATTTNATTTGSAYIAGNLGVGNTSPTFKLDVTGTGHFTSSVAIATTTTDAGYALTVGTASANDVGIMIDARSSSDNYATYGLQNKSQWWSTQIRTDQSNAYTVRNETGGTNPLILSTTGNLAITGTGTFGTNAVINGGGASYFNGGNVGIGTTDPKTLLDLSKATVLPGAGYGNLFIRSSDAVAANKGGVINFGGNYTGTTEADWAGIAGLKDNATDGQYGGYLSFYTRTNGSPTAERMRIDSNGSVFVGATGSATNVATSTFTSVNGTGGVKLAAMFENRGTTDNSTYTGIGFSANDQTVAKGGILYQRTTGGGVGKLHFATNGTVDNTTGISPSDIRMTIDSSGNVGIGTTTITTTGTRLGIGGGNILMNVGTANQHTNFNTFNYGLAFEDGTLNPGNGPGALITATRGTAYGADLQFVTRSDAGGTAVERMRITQAGNVGIGTTSPNTKLVVVGNVALGNVSNANSSAWPFTVHLGTNSNINFRDESGVASIQAINDAGDGGGNLNFDVPFTQFSGSVGVGVANVQGLLKIYAGNAGGAFSQIHADNSNLGRLVLTGAAGGTGQTENTVVTPHLYPYADNTYALGSASLRWTAVTAVNGTIQTSDARLKENVATTTHGLSDVMRLRPVSYTWIANPEEGTKLGFIAQEVQPILPEAVNVGTDANHTLGLNYSEFAPVLAKAIQELNGKVDGLFASTSLSDLLSSASSSASVPQSSASGVFASASDTVKGALTFATQTWGEAFRGIGNSVVAGVGAFDQVIANKVTTDTLVATTASTTNLWAVSASTTNLVATNATTTNLATQKLCVGSACVDGSGFSALVASATSAASSVASTTASAIASMADVLSGLKDAGVWIANGIARIANLVADNLTVGTSTHPAGITLFDQTTGSPYCLQVVGGVSTTTPGACPLVVDSQWSIVNSNSSSTLSTINSQLSTAPVLQVNGANPATIDVGATYSDLGAVITGPTDADKALGIHVSVDGGATTTPDQIQIDTTTAGTHTVSYFATNTNGLTGYATRTVNVVAAAGAATTTPDTIAPVITLLGDATVTLTQGATYTDAGATAADNVDGDLTAAIAAVNPVDANTPGTYQVTYNVSDTAGNAATQAVRTVTVEAATPTP